MLWTVLCVFCLASTALSASKKERKMTGIIHDYLVKHINHNISPCDNFYNHACPKDVPIDEVPMNNIFPTDFLALIDQRQKPNHLELDLAKADKGASSFYSGLRKHLAIVDYVNEKYPDSVPIAYPLREKLTLLAQTIVEQIRKSVPYQNQNTTDFLVHQALRTNYFTGWTNLDYDGLAEYYDEVNSQYEELLEKTDAETALSFIDKEIRSIALLDTVLDTIIRRVTEFQSMYIPETADPLLFNALYLISLGEDPAVQHGSTLMVAAHEMHHSVFDLIENTFKNDSKALEHWKCLADHNQKVSKMYHDEAGASDPNTPEHQSSMYTFHDDAPDLEGLHASYTMLRDVSKLDMEAKPYADLPLSRAKLFFYSYAATFCLPAVGQNHSQVDTHSAFFTRINGPFSLMKAFIDTFQCGPETRMGKLYHDAPAGKCNQLGDAVKRA